jgi:hypothetical protein
MRRTFALFLAATLAAASIYAQTQVVAPLNAKDGALAYLWDMDGEADDDDQIVLSANLADSTTYGLAAQPDSCRLVVATVTDANSSTTAGTVTISGTDCFGAARVGVFDFAVVATRGSGVKTFTLTTGLVGGGLYLRSVTSVITDALTGEDGGAVDLLKVGYTADSVNAQAAFGVVKTRSSGERYVDHFDSLRSVSATAPLLDRRITTAGVSTTTVTSVATNAAFTDVVVGDLLLFTVGDQEYKRVVLTRASADSITITGGAVKIPADGVPFRFRHFYTSTDPLDDLWVRLGDNRGAWFEWGVSANANTGGVIVTLECASIGPGWPVPAITHTVGTSTVATGATGSGFWGVDRSAAPVDACRMLWKFGTGDDADAAPEAITANVTLEK